MASLSLSLVDWVGVGAGAALDGEWVPRGSASTLQGARLGRLVGVVLRVMYVVFGGGSGRFDCCGEGGASAGEADLRPRLVTLWYWGLLF
jgi:hypothetical protein